MVEYVWPDRKDSSVLGKSHDKLDAIPKCTGAAKYSYDINPPKMLLARVLGCPHAHCKVKSIEAATALAATAGVQVSPSGVVGKGHKVRAQDPESTSPKVPRGTVVTIFF